MSFAARRHGLPGCARPASPSSDLTLSTPIRLGLIGAFAFPAPKGSQLYARDQARALSRAGAELWFLTYGYADGPPPEGLRVLRIARTWSPRGSRTGFRVRKPFADAALLQLVVAATRRERFDALLAHNAEAALVALAARRFTGVPVVYVAHTLWEAELPSYGPRALAAPLTRVGRALDTLLARRADAVLALSRQAAERLSAARVIDVIPPGLDPQPAPGDDEVKRACERFGLAPGGYALYAGNLDAYQHLERLDAAAARVTALPVVVATHARGPSRWRHLRVARSDDVAEVRALLHGAALLVTARAPHGGLPIKLLNYMEAGRAIVARAGVADSLRHGESAWLVPEQTGAEALAAAIDALARDPQRAAELGRGARAVLLREHAWSALAQRTLELVARARSERRAR